MSPSTLFLKLCYLCDQYDSTQACKGNRFMRHDNISHHLEIVGHWCGRFGGAVALTVSLFTQLHLTNSLKYYLSQFDKWSLISGGRHKWLL